MSDVGADDLNQLITTLTGLSLPAPQRRLLDAVIQVLRDVRDPDDRAFGAEFRDAFSAKRTDLLPERTDHPVPDAEHITRQPSEGIIRRGPGHDERP